MSPELLIPCIVAVFAFVMFLNIAFSAPSWCQDCKAANREATETVMLGYNPSSSYCNRHGRMFFRGFDRPD
jgi:hypothetical protein